MARGRPKKDTQAEAQNGLIHIGDMRPLERLDPDDPQVQALHELSLKMTYASSKRETLEQKKVALDKQLKSSGLYKESVKIKRMIRDLNAAHKEATSNFNGGLKILLAGYVEGDSLEEKFENLDAGRGIIKALPEKSDE